MQPSPRVPVTWHHGLLARWWAEVNAPEPDELAYYRAAIERHGEPALDLGCGTGRLLVPLLASGLDVDGVDVSADMLAQARKAGAAVGLGLDGRLRREAFHELSPGRRYRTILCCDSFAIGGSRADDATALARIHDALQPGGVFVFSIDLPYAPEIIRPAEPPRVLPRPWPEGGSRRALADGDELELVSRVAAYDAAERRETMDIRARLWRGEELLAEEHGSLQFIHYDPDELRAMLQAAGFDGLVVEGRYTGRPPEPSEETIVITARRVS
jgi:SAM-dependent methyltransferase